MRISRLCACIRGVALPGPHAIQAHSWFFAPRYRSAPFLHSLRIICGERPDGSSRTLLRLPETGDKARKYPGNDLKKGIIAVATAAPRPLIFLICAVRRSFFIRSFMHQDTLSYYDKKGCDGRRGTFSVFYAGYPDKNKTGQIYKNAIR